MNRMYTTLFLVIVFLQCADAQEVRARTRSGSFGVPEQKEVIIPKDETPPTIEILEPADFVQRGMKNISETRLILTSSTFVLRGLARDPGGVARVLVNGEETQLKRSGEATEFSSTVLLAMGDNQVEVKAVDRFRNEGSILLHVRREEALIKGKYFALVVAIQNYKDRSMHSLDYPLRDAEDIIAMLSRDYTFDEQNILFLKNPDRRSIINALEALRSRVTADDNLLVFYAGHGYWDEGLRQGFWLPVNASANDPSEWLPNSTVRDYIRGIKSKHTLLLADACFSGGIFRTREAFVRPDASIQRTYEMPSRRAMTSGALKTVPDRSVFVEYFLKRLKENREKYLYAEKLYVSMKDAVINNSPNNQTPLYGVINEAGDEGGDFIFVRR